MTVQSALPTWELDQLTRLYQRRPDLVRAALQRLLAEEPELRWSLIVGAYLDHQINLGKAAELLEMDAFQLQARFLELGIPLRLGPADVDEARAEVAAARRWVSPLPEDKGPRA